MYLVEVIPLVYLPRGVNQTFTYRVTPPLERSVKSHALVLIPFRRRLVAGVIVGLKRRAPPPTFTLQVVQAVLPYPPLNHVQRHLADALQNHYAATATLAYKTVVPTRLIRRPTPEETTAPQRMASSPSSVPALPYAIPRAARQALLKAPVGASLIGRICDPRDEVFLAYTQHHLKRTNIQVLILLPDKQSLELAANTYRERFWPLATTWHSDLKSRDQSAVWQTVASGQLRVILATRSGCFLPFRSLGAVLLFDESNDGYKSWDQQPYYDARYLTRLLVRFPATPLVTTRLVPALESDGRPVIRLPLPTPSATVTVCDRQAMHRAHGEAATIPEPALLALAQASAEHPALVFTNRLGYAGIICRDCGYVARCQRCQALLTYQTAISASITQKLHDEATVSARSMELRCRRCHEAATVPALCPVCRGTNLRFLGLGTERVESELRRLLPAHEIMRVDAQTVPTSTRSASIADAMYANQPSVIVASPFILSRLWTIPRFSTVVALQSESLLLASDWRVNERAVATLELLRHAAEHHFFIETNLPRHPVFRALATGTFATLLKQELKDRQRFSYPPYSRLVTLVPDNVHSNDITTARFLRQVEALGGTTVVSSESRRGRYWLLRLPPHASLKKLGASLPVGWKADVDPVALPD